jgi:hypothetical protein
MPTTMAVRKIADPAMMVASATRVNNNMRSHLRRTLAAGLR